MAGLMRLGADNGPKATVQLWVCQAERSSLGPARYQLEPLLEAVTSR